jgi:type IV secretory pathway TraG/TraD family ATPase VirD4
MSNPTIQPLPPTPQQEPDYSLLGLLMCIPLIAWLYWQGSRRKPKIGRSRMATDSEVRRSRDEAIKAINDPHEFSLWIGMPDKFSKHPKTGEIALIPNRETVMLRKANEHIMVYGTTGSGKTRYLLNRLGFAAVMRELPIIAVDLKGDEEQYRGYRIAPTSELAGFALEHGYEIFPIAPFFPDSKCLNLVSLIKNPSDIATANQLSDAFVENCREDGEQGDFWSKAGSKLVAADFLMARGLEHGADLATCQKILARLNEDPESIRSAKITQYQKAAYDQFLGAVKSPETASSIVVTAMDVLARFIVPEITAVFCGKTNIPIVLKPKQMLIFRVDPTQMSSVMPLVAAAVEILLQRNVFSGSQHGGLALFDELPQYKLPRLAKIMAVARSKKWSIALGAQGESILKEEYGDRRTEAILENVQTVAVMRLASNATSKSFSESLGQEDTKTKSRSSGKGGDSTTTQEQQRTLVPVEELQQQPTGRCILLTPGVSAQMEGGIKGEKRVRIPYRHQFKIPNREKVAMKRSETNWKKHRKKLIETSIANPFTERQLLAREMLAAQLLPSATHFEKINFENALKELFSEKSI